MLKQEFFSKKNIKGLNSKLLNKNNLESISREEKKRIVNILIGNMKKIYKNIDAGRVNKSNLESIKNQFNEWVFNETNDYLGNNRKKPKKKLADIRFQREYSSNPNTKVRYMDRPEIILTNSDSSDLRNESMESYFKPLEVNNNTSIPNNYKTSEQSIDVTTINKLNQIQQLRSNELPNQARPETPDFLKPERVGKVDKDYSHQESNKNDNFKVLDFKNNQTDIYNGLEGNNNQVGSFINGNDPGGDLFSIDNIDTPLTKMEMVEDSSSFEDRFKRLQRDRDILELPNKNEKKLQVPNNNFRQDNNGRESLQVPNNNFRQDNNGRESLQAPNNNYRQYNNGRESLQAPNNNYRQDNNGRESLQAPNNNYRQDNNEIRREQINYADVMDQTVAKFNVRESLQVPINLKKIKIKKSEKVDTIKQNNLFSEENVLIKSKSKTIFSEDNNSRESVGNEDTYKKMIQLLRKEVNILKVTNSNLQKELNSNSDLSDGSNELRKKIIEEWRKLEEKSSVVDINLKLLQQKELELVNKEEDIKKLMASYNYMFMTKYLQLEVTSNDMISSYSYPFNSINNVVGIKLLSYSLPQSRYNITDSNNKLTITIDEDESIIILDNGYYTITDLIEILNKKSNLNFELSINQKVKVSCDNIFSIEKSVLLNKVLGFEERLEGEKEYNAAKLFDLRVDNKVYLFLKNLNATEPFGVLHFHGQSICEFRLNNPINLDYLEIEFRDNNDNVYNFYNLPHYLSFQLEVVKSNYESVSL
jgi:hypothetical protein